MSLQRLTQIGVKEVTDELQSLAESIRDYLAILASRERIMAIISDELREVKQLFAVPRRTEITEWSGDMMDEDLIEREDMVVTVTMQGYIKRTPLDAFRAQARGGKGRSGMATKDEDAVVEMFVTSTHNPVLFFTNTGRVYRLKVWKLPEGGPQTKGRPMVNLLPLGDDERVTNVLPLPEDENEWSALNIVFATEQGMVRRNSMDSFTNVPSNGKYAMGFVEGSGDRLIGVRLLKEDQEIFLASDAGKAILEVCWEHNISEVSFHGRFRDECLNREQLWTLTEARVVIEDYRCEYNQRRPHSRLGYQSPARFAAQCSPSPSAVGLRPPSVGDGQTQNPSAK